MSDKFKLIATVHIFLTNSDNEILLLRRFNTGYEDGNYSVIAGHIDGNEEVKAAAIREAKEETGIEIQPSDIEVVGVMHRKSDSERVSFFLAASRWTGDIVNAEPDKCDDISWHSVHNLPANMVPYVRQALENYRKGRFFESFGWEKQE
jgi:8-oxo-dGTP pyrophosphatase MutT (NUDIX family)